MTEKIGQDDIDALLAGAFADAQDAIDDLDDAGGSGDAGPAIMVDEDRMNLLGDVELGVSIELGRTEMMVEDVLKLGSGAVVELDKLAGDPVDVRVNGRLVARGEVIVLNDNFCIRISEIVENLEEQAREVAKQAGAGDGFEAEAQSGAEAGV